MNIRRVSSFFSIVFSYIALVSVTHAQITILTPSESSAISVNNTGQVVGRALNGPFIAQLVNGVPNVQQLAAGSDCRPTFISNGGAILARCESGPAVWKSSQPGVLPAQIEPSAGIAGIGADITAFAIAMNDQGRVIGHSISSTRDRHPVIWSTNYRNVIVLPGPSLLGLPPIIGLPANLLNSSVGCVPLDLTNSPAPTTLNPNPLIPVIVGSCPNVNSTGNKVPVAWISNPLLGGYTYHPLPLPVGATSCEAEAINDQQKIAGSCYFSVNIDGTVRQAVRTVSWSGPRNANSKVLVQSVYHSAIGNNLDSSCNTKAEAILTQVGCGRQKRIVGINANGFIVSAYNVYSESNDNNYTAGEAGSGLDSVFIWNPSTDAVINNGGGVLGFKAAVTIDDKRYYQDNLFNPKQLRIVGDNNMIFAGSLSFDPFTNTDVDNVVPFSWRAPQSPSNYQSWIPDGFFYSDATDLSTSGCWATATTIFSGDTGPRATLINLCSTAPPVM